MMKMRWMVACGVCGAAFVVGCQKPAVPPVRVEMPAEVAVPPAEVRVVRADSTLFTEKDPIYTAATALVNWWPGDGHGLDLVGQRHAVLRNGTTYAPGRVGLAFTFDGVSNFVDLGMANPPTPAGAFTMMMWFRAEKQPRWQYLAFCWGDRGMDISIHNIKLGNVSGNLGLGTGYDEFHGKIWNGADTSFQPYEEWHHLAFTYDGKHAALYRDGELGNEIAWSTYTPSNTPLLLGTSDRDTGCEPFKGQMQDVALFRRGLSAAGVGAVYQAQTAPVAVEFGVTEWVRFDDALTGREAPLAWYAAQRMPAGGNAVVAHFATAVAPADGAGPSVEAVEGLIRALDADAYAERERASAALRSYGPGIASRLRAALEKSPSSEVRNRLQLLLEGMHTEAFSPEEVHAARIAAILTRVRTREAVELTDRLHR